MVNQPLIYIAYAEDHKIVRKGIINFIHESSCFLVDIEADNGLDLINAIKKSKRIPDICILDLNMPVLNGFDTILELKKKWPDIKILILTVFEIELYIIRAIMYGANGYLLKRCDPDDVKKALESIYHDGIYYSEIATRNFFQAVRDKKIKFPNLTQKEIKVLKYCCSSMSYVEIATEMHTTSRSVEGHRDSLFKKLNTNSRVGLVMFAIQFGIANVEIDTSEDRKIFK